jgi:hypothetical protein
MREDKNGSVTMNWSPAILLLPGVLLACAQPQSAAEPPPPAPPPAAVAPPATQVATDRYVSIRGATCATLLGLSPEDRTIAAMFYIGYQANRFGTRAINVSRIPSITGLAMDYCLAEPNRTVADAFAEAYSDTRRW